MSARVKGYLCVIASAVLFGLYPIMAKFAFAGGATPQNLLILKGTALLPLGIIAFFFQKEEFRIPRGKQARDIGILALTGAFLTPLLLLLSYTFISSGVATSLHYAYCVITLLLCIIIYHEKFDVVKAICVAACVSGVFLLYANSTEGSALGVTFALASAVTYAVYTVYLDKSGLHAMDPIRLQFVLLCLSVPLSIVYTAATGALVFKMSAPSWGATLIFYMFGGCAATILYQLGVHHIGSQRSTILSTIEPLTSAVLGVFLFSERLTWRSALGMAVILIAAVLIASVDGLREKRRQP